MTEEQKSDFRGWKFIAFLLFLAVVILSYFLVQNNLSSTGSAVKDDFNSGIYKKYDIKSYSDSQLDALVSDSVSQAISERIILSKEEIPRID